MPATTRRWRVRWREDVLDVASGERRRVQRERVVRDRSTATILQTKLLRALERADVVPSEAIARPARVATRDEAALRRARDRVASLEADLVEARAQLAMLDEIDGFQPEDRPAALESSLGLAPWCTGCERHRVAGGGLCPRCLDDERRER